MRIGNLQQLLKIASAGSMDRIREDHDQRASAKVKPLLKHIEKHLFEAQLNVKSLMKACGVRDRSMSSAFARDVKVLPAAYICDRRIETTVLLLRDTNLDLTTIGAMVFGCDLSSFSHRFDRWAGMSPKKYRKAIRADPSSVRLPGWPASASRSLTVDCWKVERGVALVHWEELRYLPTKKQLELVRQPYGITTPALFDVLREKSREEGRKDRQAGVRLAELALASLDGVASFLTPDELANRKAQGTAWLGNALRLALDFPSAERAFVKAPKLLPKEPEPLVLAEIYDLEAQLLLFQSKVDRALELKHRAVDLFASVGNNQLLARALISRAKAIGRAQGWESAIPDFLRAVDAAESAKEPRLIACAHQALVGGYTLAGQIESAVQLLPEAREHCAKAGDLLLGFQLQWVEGTIAKEAGRSSLCEELFLAARAGFAAAGEIGYAAAVDLDLAEVFLAQGRDFEAVAHALAAIPIFKHFRAHREAISALALLAKAAEEQVVTLDVVQKIRAHLQELLQSPSSFKA